MDETQYYADCYAQLCSEALTSLPKWSELSHAERSLFELGFHYGQRNGMGEWPAQGLRRPNGGGF